jgi:phosphate transport system permease protein
LNLRIKTYNLRLIREKFSSSWMLNSLIIIILLPVAIGFGLVYKSTFLIHKTSLLDLLFSSIWQPLSGKFGFLAFILSSVWITLIAVVISAPICLLTAIFLTQYAKKFVLRIMQPIIDILAGIPSVIFGVWGIIIIVPIVSNYIAPFFGYQTSGYTILSGAIVLSIMIIPFILNIIIEVFNTIPDELTEVSLSLGATKWETIKKVMVRKAFPGIASALGLGVSRAFGETIAVLMVVGNVIQIPHNIFQAGYPLPALIANNYGEMMSIPMYDSALMFAALILFVVVLVFNILSRLAIIRLEKRI